MLNAKYSDDGSKIVLDRRSYGRKNTEVPVSLVHSIIDSGISLRDIEEAVMFVRVTKNGSPEWFTMESLHNVDLTGKIVYVFHSNYEDSEWVSTSQAVGVQQEDENYFNFVIVENEDDDRYDMLVGYSFFKTERVLVITPHAQS